MARRQYLDASDSLELLLDTICNVFGGIIFIAILVSMLTSHTTQLVQSVHAHQREVLAAARESRTLQNEIAALEAGLTELDRVDESIGTDSSRTTSRVLSLIAQRQREADDRHDRAQRWLDEYQTLVGRKLSEIDHRLADARHDVEALDKTLGELQSTRTIRGRLPFERLTDRNQIIIILRYGRAYAVPLGRSGPTIISKGLDADVQVKEPDRSHQLVTPIKSRGILVDRDIQNSKPLATLLSAFDSRQWFVDVFAYPDSSQAFRQFRDAIVDRGYMYNVHPVDSNDNTITFTYTDVVSVQ